jgi:hypothetical protein
MSLAKGLAHMGGALLALFVAHACVNPAGAQAQGQPFGQATVVGDVLFLEATAGVENRIQVNPRDPDWRSPTTGARGSPVRAARRTGTRSSVRRQR